MGPFIMALLPVHDSHVIEKLRGGLDTRHQQMIPRPRAGNAKQGALGVLHFLQIGVVADRLDELLQGNDLVIAGHHDHGAELQTFGKVHGAD